MSNWDLRLGDCLGPEGLVTLADRSVDITLSDPPFSERVHARLGKEDRCDGRKARDALTFEHLTDTEAYAMAAQLCRVTREWIILFCDEVSLVPWKDAIEAADGHKRLVLPQSATIKGKRYGRRVRMTALG